MILFLTFVIVLCATQMRTVFIRKNALMRSFLEACRTKYGLFLWNRLCDIFMFGCFILKSEYTSDCDFFNIWTGWLEYVLGPMRTLFTSFLFFILIAPFPNKMRKHRALKKLRNSLPKSSTMRVSTVVAV
jgi:hypothetical protein